MKKLFLVFTILPIFLFTSCDFESIVNTLSKTGVNVFAGSTTIDENVDAAIGSVSTAIEDFDKNLAGVAENVADAVSAYGEHKDLGEAVQSILGNVRIDTETYLDILSDVSKASLTDEGMAKFADSILSTNVVLTESKDAVIDALTGIRDCLDQENDGLAADYKDLAYDIIDALIQNEDEAEYSVPFSDVLIVSLLATAACDAIGVMKDSEQAGTDLKADVLNNTDLISEIVGVVQVASVLSKGAEKIGKETSKIVQAIAGLDEIISRVMQ